MSEAEPQLGTLSEHLRELASTYGRLQRTAEMHRVLCRLADAKDISNVVRLEIIDQLRSLHEPGGPLGDPVDYDRWTLRAADLETVFDRSVSRYMECVARWGIDKTVEHSRTCPTAEKRAALWLAWVGVNDSNIDQVAKIFTEANWLDDLPAWGNKAIAVYRRIPPLALMASAKALHHYLAIGSAEKKPLLVALAGMNAGRVLEDADTEKLARALLDSYSNWGTLVEDAADLGLPPELSRASEILLAKLVEFSGEGSLASEVATQLLAQDPSNKATMAAMIAMTFVGQSAIGSYREVFFELIRRAQHVKKTEWPVLQKAISADTKSEASCARLLVKLLVETMRTDGSRPDTFVEYVQTLAAELPNEHVDLLNNIVALAEPFVISDPQCQRAIASVKDCMGDVSSELDIWLRLSQCSPPLADDEVSRALQLLFKDGRWGLESERATIALLLIGKERLGNNLANILSPFVITMPINQFSAWADSIIGSPDVWAASWVAWLRRNRALTHFQGLLKRNPLWQSTLAQAGDVSKEILLEFLPSEIVASSAELRSLMIKSLAHNPNAVKHVSSWINNGDQLSADEEEGIKAYVSRGPNEIKGRDSVIGNWTILKAYATKAFLNSSVGIERWLSTLSVIAAPIDESILNSLASAASSARLDRDLVRVVAKLQLAIDSTPISEEAKAAIRSQIREVSLCRQCNGSGKATLACASCGGTGSITNETTLKDICDRCGGDGGAGGRCPKCFGNGWMENTTYGHTKCSSCAGVGNLKVPCTLCGQSGVILNN